MKFTYVNLNGCEKFTGWIAVYFGNKLITLIDKPELADEIKTSIDNLNSEQVNLDISKELIQKECQITDLKARLEVAESTIAKIHDKDCNCLICQEYKKKEV